MVLGSKTLMTFGLAEIFVGYSEGTVDALRGNALVLATHQASWDAAIAMQISDITHAEFHHIASAEVLGGSPYLRRLGFNALPESGSAFERLDAIEEMAEQLADKNAAHLWVMPAQGHWPALDGGEHSSIGSLFRRYLPDSFATVGCSISYVVRSTRRPIALAWLEVREVAGPELQSRSVGAWLGDMNERAWQEFVGAGDLIALLHGDRFAIVAGVPVDRLAISNTIERVAGPRSAHTIVVNGRLLFRDVDADLIEPLSRAFVSRFGLNLGRELRILMRQGEPR